MSTIVVPSTALFFYVTTYRLTNFPSTGTYIAIAKDTEDNVPTSGQHNTLTHTENNDDLHRITVTLMQGHPDDAFMMGIIKAQRLFSGVVAVSYQWGTTKYTSVNARVSKKPDRELGADSIGNVAYVIAGSFPDAIIGAFAQPPEITQAQIEAQIPA
jgi:hypothetical protein